MLGTMSSSSKIDSSIFGGLGCTSSDYFPGRFVQSAQSIGWCCKYSVPTPLIKAALTTSWRCEGALFRATQNAFSTLKPSIICRPAGSCLSSRKSSGQIKSNSSVKDHSSASSDIDLQHVMSILKEDLPEQYRKEMDWTIYDDHVIFVDPVTRLKGKLLYRGMIATLRLLTFIAFEGTSPMFDLISIQEVGTEAITTSAYSPKDPGKDISSVRAIRTVWSTSGRTRWGAFVEITGDDIFRINSRGLIMSHESAWNEDPSSIKMM